MRAPGKEEEAQEEDVVEGHLRGLYLSPREGRRLANHPEERGRYRQADGGGDGQRPDVAMVLGDEEPDSRGEEED